MFGDLEPWFWLIEYAKGVVHDADNVMVELFDYTIT